MAFLQKKNNVKSHVEDNPLSAGATTLNVHAGDGAKFPAVGDFILTIWDKVTYPDPSDDSNMEIVRATARTTDAITITRAQEGRTGVSHPQNSAVEMLITAGTLDEAFNQNLTTTDGPTFGGLSVTNAGADSTTTITGGTRANLFLSNTNANAGARNWRIAAQYTNYGTLDFVVGTSQGAAPSVVAAYFDSSYNLNLASHKLYLNATAYLDGATAGVVGIGAAGIAGATLSVGDVNASGLATPLALSMGGTYCTSAGQPGKCKIKVFDMGGTTTTYGFNVSDSLLEIHSASATAFYSAGTERFRVAATGAITSTKSVTHQIGNLQISDDATYCSLTRVA